MKWAIVLAVAACAALAAPCGAEDHYPSRPVKLVLPQPAGGAVDLIARALADRLAEQMGRPFIVENMPGANGSLAGGNVARAPSDGYTLMLAVDSNLVINPSLYHTLTYDPFKDFAPISIIARLNMVLVANPKVSANSVKELIAYALPSGIPALVAAGQNDKLNAAAAYIRQLQCVCHERATLLINL
jgi:tripartite-type tricarboxylate transporter receptor subunit TctC